MRERNVERDRAESLAKKLEELTGGNTAFGEQPYQSQVQPGSEVTPEQYQQDVTRTADALVQLRIKQQEVRNNINRDAELAMKTHAELDPDSDAFDKNLSDAITEASYGYMSKNPTASLKAYVDRLMKPYKRSIDKAVSEETANVAKQVAETAIRPTTIRQPEKSVDEMSIDELREKLGIVF